MPWSRIWTFMFACALAAEWFFPPVDTAYSFLSSTTPFKVERSRPFVTETFLGSTWTIIELGGRARVNRTRTLDRNGQILQTALIVVFFLGLRWVLDPGVFLRWYRYVSRRT